MNPIKQVRKNLEKTKTKFVKITKKWLIVLLTLLILNLILTATILFFVVRK